MKKMITVFLMMCVAASAYAVGSKKTGCKKMEEVCKSAGYTKHGTKNDHKSMRQDCMEPLLEGTLIEGVNVDAADLDACKKTMAKRMEKKLEVKKEAAEKRVEGHTN